MLELPSGLGAAAKVPWSKWGIPDTRTSFCLLGVGSTRLAPGARSARANDPGADPARPMIRKEVAEVTPGDPRRRAAVTVSPVDRSLADEQEADVFAVLVHGDLDRDAGEAERGKAYRETVPSHMDILRVG